MEQLPIAIPSMSLGRAARHELEPKLQAAFDAGFKGIEVFYEDIKIPARKYMSEKPCTFEQALLQSAQYCQDLCGKFDLTIICLQPFKLRGIEKQGTTYGEDCKITHLVQNR